MIVTEKMAEEARNTLEIAQPLGQFDAEHVKRMFYLRAMEHHPDKGGDAATFASMDRAKHVLLAWLDRQSASEGPVAAHGGGPCPRCQGSSYLTLRKGFRELRLTCPACRGSGEAGVEHEKEGQ